MGETNYGLRFLTRGLTFSILERIDVGETILGEDAQVFDDNLSVSSNGSTWVKLFEGFHLDFIRYLSVSSNGSTWVKPKGRQPDFRGFSSFQYPRTDRRG